MSKQTILLGTAPTGVGGDTPRSAFTKSQSNFDELYTFLGASGSPAALPPALPVAHGGTGGNTQALARAGLGLKSAALADAVGSVSQSGGVSTGAIIERGSNSNGEFTKYADGTLDCWITGSNATSVPTNTGIEITVNYPQTFVGVPTITGCCGLSTGGTSGLAARIAIGFPFTASGASSARVHIFNTTGITIGGFSYFLIIKGRWY